MRQACCNCFHLDPEPPWAGFTCLLMSAELQDSCTTPTASTCLDLRSLIQKQCQVYTCGGQTNTFQHLQIRHQPCLFLLLHKQCCSAVFCPPAQSVLVSTASDLLRDSTRRDTGIQQRLLFDQLPCAHRRVNWGFQQMLPGLLLLSKLIISNNLQS